MRTPCPRGPRARRSQALATAAAIAALLLAPGCDRGLEAEPPLTGIAGTVTFLGEWTEEIGEVAVAVYRDLPPREAQGVMETGLESLRNLTRDDSW